MFSVPLEILRDIIVFDDKNCQEIYHIEKDGVSFLFFFLNPVM